MGVCSSAPQRFKILSDWKLHNEFELTPKIQDYNLATTNFQTVQLKNWVFEKKKENEYKNEHCVYMSNLNVEKSEVYF